MLKEEEFCKNKNNVFRILEYDVVMYIMVINWD